MAALAVAAASRIAGAEPLRTCFVSGSFEYDSDTALSSFEEYFEARYDAQVTLLKATDWDVLPGLEALEECDVALFFTRRLTIGGDALERIRRYAKTKPLVAVRTASHGFQNYLEFDREVLGGNYQGHFDDGPSVLTTVQPGVRAHPVLKGVEHIRSPYSLYKSGPVAPDATVLMTGRTPFSEGDQPVTWLRERGGQRVFYTSLGGVSDFEGASFRRMVANALFWAAGRKPVEKALPQLASRPAKTGTFALRIRARAREEGSGPEETEINLDMDKTAVLVCDMWDKHWCSFANDRVAAMAPRVDEVLSAARTTGMLIIHAPSDTLGFYADTPARRRAQSAAPVESRELRQIEEGPLPIDDSDGGCPENCVVYAPWSRQNGAIRIDDFDVISDDGAEIYSVLRQEGIETILYTGVHTNMCVLGRSFGIRQMSRWGVNCILVRDLTDTMYDPAMPPRVSHDEGTELVVQHIEKYWGPTTTSVDLLDALSK